VRLLCEVHKVNTQYEGQPVSFSKPILFILAWKVHSKGIICSQSQRFWPLKCLNWSLGVSHMKFAGRTGRNGKEGDKLNCFLPLPSFSLWSAYWALPPRSETKNGGGYCNSMEQKLISQPGSPSAGQKIRLLCLQNIHHHVHWTTS
jgi:hypothetical protein